MESSSRQSAVQNLHSTTATHEYCRLPSHRRTSSLVEPIVASTSNNEHQHPGLVKNISLHLYDRRQESTVPGIISSTAADVELVLFDKSAKPSPTTEHQTNINSHINNMKATPTKMQLEFDRGCSDSLRLEIPSSDANRVLSSDSNTYDCDPPYPSSPTPSTDSSTPILHAYEFAFDKERDVAAVDDRTRCLIAFLLLFAAGFLNDVALAFIHERVPEYKPLPDLFFQNTPYLPGALKISEIAMLTNSVMAFAVCILSNQRYTLLKRLFLISAMLYGGRAATMMVTQVPVADPKYYCAPKTNETSALKIFERALSLVSGLGLSMGGKHVLCGDYIYSGHTVVLVHSYMVVRYYTPRRWKWLHWVSWCLATAGVICLLLSRGHYTVDVILAYWITSRLFAAYHTMCNIPALRARSHSNLMSRFCWHPLFRYMEYHTPCKLTLRFDWPLPWPRVMHRIGIASKTNIS